MVCTGTPEKKENEENKNMKERKEKTQKRRKIKERKTKQTCGASRVPRGQGCCLLVRSVLRCVQLMCQRKDDIIRRPDGRQDKKRVYRDNELTGSD